MKASETESLDFSLRVKKWTTAEKSSVLSLRTKGLGPLAISRKTGIPLNQIRFWLYGPRGSKRSKVNPKSHTESQVRRYYRTQYADWYSWKSSILRSTFQQIAKKHGLLYSPTGPDIKAWLIKANKACYYCQVPLTEKNLGVDHLQPVSRKGTNEFTNLALTCRSCNSAKGSMSEMEFRGLLLMIANWEETAAKSLLARLKRGFKTG